MAKSKKPDTELAKEANAPEVASVENAKDAVGKEANASNAEVTEAPAKSDKKYIALLKDTDEKLTAFMESYKRLLEVNTNQAGTYNLFKHYAEHLHVQLKYALERA